MEHAESRSGVVEMGQVEESRNDRNRFLIRNEAQRQDLGKLISEGKKEDNRVFFPPRISMLGIHAETGKASTQRPQSVGCSAWEPTSSR